MSTEPELIDLYPVEFSRSGSNAHYHFCPIRGCQQSYGVCMHILDAIKEDRLTKDSFVDCQRAYLRDDCEAKRMRAEEIAANRSIYYKPRTNLNPVNTRPERDAQDKALVISSGKYDMSNPSFARGWNMAGGDSEKSGRPINKAPSGGARPAPPKAAPPKPKSGFIEESMADLVNVIASEKPKAAEAKPKAAAPASTPTQTIKPNPGETPLEFARRRAAILRGDN